MITTAEFSTIDGFSKLYTDFLTKDSVAWQRFEANHYPGHTFNKRLKSFKNRIPMQEIFKTTMEKLPIAAEQQENLKLLKNDNSLVIITGQQVGLFGGALYTFFKAQSAIAQAKKLSAEYPAYTFIPVFWVEDNDHDRAEAEHTAILTKDYHVRSLKAPGDFEHNGGVCIGEIHLTEDITPFLQDIAAELPASPYSDDITTLLKEIYTPGKLWSDAYTELLHYFFKNTGLLFVKGSEVRKSGLAKALILKELSEAGASKAAAEKAGAELLKAGYHVQAEPSDVHLFLHEGVQRFKINKNDRGGFSVQGKDYSKDELLKIAENNPERFSPNVLLRPIAQDVAFPTAAYIAGPGELSYAAELPEMYEYFGVEMPMFISRCSATFVDFKAQKFLLKQEMDVTEFMKPWQSVERDFAVKISDAEINALFEKNESQMLSFFADLRTRAMAIDKTLVGAVDASKAITGKQYIKLFKKITAGQKRRESELLKKYRETWAMIFPDGKLQERAFSIVHYFSLYGEDGVKSALNELFKIEPIQHFFIPITGTGNFSEEKVNNSYKMNTTT